MKKILPYSSWRLPLHPSHPLLVDFSQNKFLSPLFPSLPPFFSLSFTLCLFSFLHFLPSLSISSPLAPTSLTTKLTEVNDASVFQYFTNNLSVSGELAWYYDALPAADVVLDKADATGSPLVAADDMATKKSYHFFPSTEVPCFYIQLATYVDGEDVALPSYIYSKGFKTSAGEDVTFAPGYVYRMNFKGAPNNGYGDLPFEEEDINQLDKCLEITVDVIDWAVVSIYPEF